MRSTRRGRSGPAPRGAALACALAGVLVVGCGGSDPAPEPDPAMEARREALAAAPSPTPPAAEGPVFDPQDRNQLLEVYCRASKGDAAVWAELGMTNARGIPDGAKVAAYQAAIHGLSQDPAAWVAFRAEARQRCPEVVGDAP